MFALTITAFIFIALATFALGVWGMALFSETETFRTGNIFATLGVFLLVVFGTVAALVAESIAVTAILA